MIFSKFEREFAILMAWKIHTHTVVLRRVKSADNPSLRASASREAWQSILGKAVVSAIFEIWNIQNLINISKK